MKIIFLDIDGVLNNSLEVDEHKQVYLGEDYQGLYSPRCVERLNKLIEATSAKIVLSSTWRIGLNLEQVQEIMDIMGISCEVIGITDYLVERYNFRGNEIYKWIKDNSKVYSIDEFDYRSFVILDDDTDMLMWQKDNYVNCDPEIGMTDRTVAKATAILNHSPCKDVGQEFY